MEKALAPRSQVKRLRVLGAGYTSRVVSLRVLGTSKPATIILMVPTIRFDGKKASPTLVITVQLPVSFQISNKVKRLVNG